MRCHRALHISRERNESQRMRRMCVFFLLLSSTIVGCQLEPVGIQVLRRFVETDEFIFDRGSVFPKTRKVQNSLYEYADESYEDNVEVRSELAYYFLRYDHELLSRGLLTIDCRDGGFIRLLWDKESKRVTRFLESPSSGEMRKHIERDDDWFVLSERGRRQLVANKDQFEKIQKTWYRNSSSAQQDN